MIWWIICIILVAFSLNKFFFGFGAEHKYKNVLKQLQEDLYMYQQRINKNKLDEKDIRETTLAINKLKEMHEIFLHLKGKYKYSSLNKRRKITNDWLTYTRIALKMREYDPGFVKLSDDKILNKIKEKIHTDRIRAEEIEKRFKMLQSE